MSKKRLTKAISLLLTFAMLLTIGAVNVRAADALVLVENGVANAHIIVPFDASDIEKYAAEELRYHMELVSGVEVPITVTNMDATDFSSDFTESRIDTPSADWYPVKLNLKNPTENSLVLKVNQTNAAEGMPSLVIRGTDGYGEGEVFVNAGAVVQVSGLVKVPDPINFGKFTLEADVTTSITAPPTVIASVSIDLIGTGNYVTNDGMEDATGLTMGSAGSIDSSERHGGEASLKIKNGEVIVENDLELQSGNLYRLSFWVKTAGDAQLYAAVSDFDSSDVALTVPRSLYNSAGAAGTWQYREYRFNANTSGDDAYASSVLSFVASGSGDAWIDDVALIDCGPAAENLVKWNSDFESAPAAGERPFNPWYNWWSTVDRVADHYTGEYALHMKAEGAGQSNGYNDQIATTAHREFTVSFWAKAVDDAPTAFILASDAFGEASFELTNEWARYEFNFEAAGPMYFSYNYTGGGVLIDHFMIANTQAAADAPMPGMDPVASGDEIEDEGFENGGWTTADGTVSLDIKPVEASMKITGAAEISYADSIELISGNLYKLTFRAKASAADKAVYAKVADFNAEGGALSTPMSLYSRTALTTEWAEYEYRFNANPSGNAAYKDSLLSFVTTGDGDVWIDDVLLVDCGAAAENLVKWNSDFESAPLEGERPYDPWYNWYSVVDRVTDHYTGEYALHMKAEGAGSSNGYNREISTTAGTENTVSFWAKAVDGVSTTFILTSDAFGEAASFELTDEWARYELDFETAGTMYFAYNYTGGGVLIDHFAIANTQAAADVIANDSNTVISDGCESAENWTAGNAHGSFVIEGDVNAPVEDSMKITGAAELAYANSAAMTSGNLYKLTFRAKASATDNVVYAKVADFNAAGGALSTPMSLYSRTALTTEWAEYEYRFNANTSGDAAYASSVLSFVTNGDGDVWIDDVLLVDCGAAAGNLISVNSDFEAAPGSNPERPYAPWENWYSVVDRVPDHYTGEYSLHMTADGKGSASTNSYAQDILTAEGTENTVSFWAKAVNDAPTTFVLKNAAFSTSGEVSFALTDEWERYELNYEAAGSTWLRYYFTNGGLLIDHFAIANTQAAADVIANASNTVISDGCDSAANWTLYSASIDTADKHSGESSLKLVGGAKSTLLKELELGTNRYQLKFYAKADTPTEIYAKVSDYNPYGLGLAVRTSLNDKVSIGTDWTECTFDFDANTGNDVDYAYSVLELVGTSGTIRIDDLTLTSGESEPVPPPVLPAQPEIPVPVAGGIRIVVATPESYPALATMFKDDIEWLSDIGNPGDTERYGDDGFAIRQDGNTIYIFGKTAGGALNGVYDFIEENMGVLWIRADENNGLLYDKMTTITASSVNYREKSPFQIRGWHLCGSGEDGTEHSDEKTEIMMSRNKLNAKFAEFMNQYKWSWQASIGLEPVNLGHVLKHWVVNSPSYDPNETEYWNTDESGDLTVATAKQVNFWSKKTADTITDGVKKFLETTDINYVGIGIEDSDICTPSSNQPFDYATYETISVAEAESRIAAGSTTVVYPDDPAYLSTVYYTFLNYIAKQVDKVYPNVTIATFAYTFTERPPLCDLEDNILVVFAPVDEDVTQPITTDKIGPNNLVYRNIEGWKKITRNMAFYNYYGSFTPSASYERPIADRIQADLQYYAENGFAGLLPEGVADSGSGSNSWSMNALTFWLYSKLAWNPDENINALIVEFCDKAYGDASEAMQEYYALVKQGWDEGKDGVNVKWYHPLDVYMSNFVLNSGLTDDMQAALDKAFEMAEGTAKERIRYIKAKFEENIRESTFQEEEAAAIRTEAGKDAVLATVQLDDPYADDIWANAPVLKQFMASGTKNPVEGADIKVRLLWDDEYLYVGYENFDTSIDDIKAATKYNDKGSWWVGGDDDVETFISADPSSGTYYGYFGNPHNLSFRYFGTGPTHDSDYNKPENSAARIINVDDTALDRWVIVQAISFADIGITGPVNSETEVYAYFYRYYDSSMIGWNGASVWMPSYLRQIELLGAEIDEAVRNVEARIDAIDEVVTKDSKPAIDAAREAYDALTEEQQKLVSNYDKLTAAEKAYDALLKDEAAAKKVADLIAAIDEVVTRDSKAGIDAARSAYDALTDAQKELVGNYKKLTDAERAYQKLLDADKAAAKAVEDLIDAIGPVTLGSKPAIDAARKAYDALTEEQKKLVGNYKKLTDAEAAYAALLQPVIPVTPKPSKPNAADNTPKFPFADVPSASWYYDSVRAAWENGLIDGVTANEFRPDNQLTVAQAIKLAAALHQMQKTGSVTLTNGAPNWYDSYVAYAVDNGIIEKDYLNYTRAQMDAPATRGEFVHIFSGALVDAAAINTVADNKIPDVKTTDKYGAEIYKFYRAGITIGSDALGTFHPASSIKRSEVAAIVLRMFDTAARKGITLK